LISSLTLFAAVARRVGPDLDALVRQAEEILDRAAEQGLPRCAFTTEFLGNRSS
jgi:hypothetical protein